MGRDTRYYFCVCLVPLFTTIFRYVEGEGMKTCFKQWHTCTDVRQQNDRYNNFLMSGRNFNNRVSNKISIVVADDYSADTEASS